MTESTRSTLRELAAILFILLGFLVPWGLFVNRITSPESA